MHQPPRDAGVHEEPAPTWSCAPTAPLPEPDLGGVAFARNVVLLMADGAGSAHYEAARAANGGRLAADRLEGPMLYATDSLAVGGPTDSAAGATAMATGRCTDNGSISVDAQGRPLTTVLELAQRAGKAVGVLTNTVLVDASPMAFTGHARSRYCAEELARDAFEVTRPDLLFGAVPDGTPSGEALATAAQAAGFAVAFDLAGLRSANPELPLLGLLGGEPSPDPRWSRAWGLTAEYLRPEHSAEPTLAELTALALTRLSRDEEGFFLFVENEHTDSIGHFASSDPAFAVELMPHLLLELDAALAQALAWVEANSSFDDTLIVVASDHETGGYTVDPEARDEASFPAAPNHTRSAVPLRARGPGSHRIADVRHLTDIFLLLTGQLDALPRDGDCPR
jgi:alkaline phosphatase